MGNEIKLWTARRKSTLVLEIIHGKTTVAEAGRSYDFPPSEIEKWVEDRKRGMGNALRTNPQNLREQTRSDQRSSRRRMARRCGSFAYKTVSLLRADAIARLEAVFA